MDISIIIVSYNNFQLLENCIRSIEYFTKKNSYEVIVVDNNSNEGDVSKLLTSHQNTILIQNSSNLGFGAANNQGIQIAKGKYCLFLNNDTEFLEDSIYKVIEFYEKNNKRVLLGCKLLNSDKTHQNF